MGVVYHLASRQCHNGVERGYGPLAMWKSWFVPVSRWFHRSVGHSESEWGLLVWAVGDTAKDILIDTSEVLILNCDTVSLLIWKIP